MLGDLTGEIAALVFAAIWAVAVVLYRMAGDWLSPLTLNLIKCALALSLLVITLFATGQAWEPLPMRAVVLLVVSGVIGFAIGDTAYFQALNDLGPRKTVLLEISSAPMAAAIAWVALGEGMSIIALLGVALVLGGVTIVIAQRTAPAYGQTGHLWRGILFGLLAALGQAAGVVLSRAAFNMSEITPLQSSVIRLGSGLLLMPLLLPFALPTRNVAQPSVSDAPTPTTSTLRSSNSSTPWRLNSLRPWLLLILAIIIGTYGGLWLQQISLKHTTPGIAQTLFSTTPLFILPIARIMGDKLSLRSVLGAVVGVIGVWLIVRG